MCWWVRGHSGHSVLVARSRGKVFSGDTYEYTYGVGGRYWWYVVVMWILAIVIHGRMERSHSQKYDRSDTRYCVLCHSTRIRAVRFREKELCASRVPWVQEYVRRVTRYCVTAQGCWWLASTRRSFALVGATHFRAFPVQARLPHPWTLSAPTLTLLELQSRLGDTPLKFQAICPQLSPKRDYGPKRVNTPLPTTCRRAVCFLFRISARACIQSTSTREGAGG